MTPSSHRRPTLADVAKLAGLSTTAVSLVLNNRPGSRLSTDAVERVHAAAAQLGYRPNPAAQSLRFGKTRTIGFVSDQVTLTRYASAMIGGVLSAARSHGYTVLMSEIGAGGDLEHAVRELTDRRVDGLLIGLMAAREVELPRIPHGVPTVMINGVSTAGHPSVLPDERRAGVAVAEYVLAAGHTRVGIVGDLPDYKVVPSASATISERFAGITETLAAAGVTPAWSNLPDWSPEIGYIYGGQFLSANPEVTAIIAGNDGVAFGLSQAATERGLGIPEDLSLISFDDEELASYMRPSLTTARLPYEEMGRRGVEMLLSEDPPALVLCEMPLMVRASVSDLNAGGS